MVFAYTIQRQHVSALTETDAVLVSNRLFLDRKPVYELASLLFSRPDDETYSSIVSGKMWESFQCALQEGVLPSALSYKAIPPSVASYRSFANQVLTAGFATSAIPVESFYKAWSNRSVDGPCVSFGLSKKCYDGDSAWDMRAFYQSRNLAIPDRFSDVPDHLSLLLETFLYIWDIEGPCSAAQFASRHLDWLEEYASRLTDVGASIRGKALEAHCFFQALTTLLIAGLESDSNRASA